MKIRTTLSLAAVLVLLTSHSFADSFVVDSAKSSVNWKGSKITGSSHSGVISLKTGTLEVKDGKIAAGSFVVDMKTLANTDLASDPDSQKKLNGHLKGDDFFKVEKFPEAKFEVTSVETKSATDVVLKGNLTLLGKTNAVEVPAKVNLAGDKATGVATLKLDRTKWGLEYASGQFFKNLGDKVISDEFELTLKLEAAKK